MAAIALLVFREVLEAALIIGIVAAATRGVPQRGRWLAAGLGLGVTGAVLVALGAGSLAEALDGVGQELFNATVLLAAVAMIGWHVVWMAVHGRALAGQMKAVGNSVQSGGAPLYVLTTVVALAVLREGSEVVLFLYGMAAGGATGVTTGLLLGIAGGSALGIALYAGLLRIPMHRFFAATNALLVLLAAGLAATAARFLVQADLLPAWHPQLWDSSWLLNDRSMLGQMLHVLIGYDARPSGTMLSFYLATVAVLVLGMRQVARWQRRAPARA